MTDTPAKHSIKKRFWLLSILGASGAAAFIPSLVAGSPDRTSLSLLIVFALIVTVVCACATWIGLRCADAANLPMPYLRKCDGVFETPAKNGFLISILVGILFAVASIALLRSLQLRNLAGPLWSRLASTLFAAGSLELVVHLLLMSLVVRLMAGRRWTGVIVAALAFVLFHASGVADQSPTVISLSVLMNGIFGLALGVIYARFGFEYVLLCHATAHILAVTVA